MQTRLCCPAVLIVLGELDLPACTKSGLEMTAALSPDIRRRNRVWFAIVLRRTRSTRVVCYRRFKLGRVVIAAPLGCPVAMWEAQARLCGPSLLIVLGDLDLPACSKSGLETTTALSPDIGRRSRVRFAIVLRRTRSTRVVCYRDSTLAASSLLRRLDVPSRCGKRKRGSATHVYSLCLENSIYPRVPKAVSG